MAFPWPQVAQGKDPAMLAVAGEPRWSEGLMPDRPHMFVPTAVAQERSCDVTVRESWTSPLTRSRTWTAANCTSADALVEPQEVTYHVDTRFKGHPMYAFQARWPEFQVTNPGHGSVDVKGSYPDGLAYPLATGGFGCVFTGGTGEYVWKIGLPEHIRAEAAVHQRVKTALSPAPARSRAKAGRPPVPDAAALARICLYESYVPSAVTKAVYAIDFYRIPAMTCPSLLGDSRNVGSLAGLRLPNVGVDISTGLQEGWMTFGDVHRALRDAAIALRGLNRAGLYHCDVKPGNLCVRRHDEDEVDMGDVCGTVVDLGLVTDLEEVERTPPQELKFPWYACPTLLAFARRPDWNTMTDTVLRDLGRRFQDVGLEFSQDKLPYVTQAAHSSPAAVLPTVDLFGWGRMAASVLSMYVAKAKVAEDVAALLTGCATVAAACCGPPVGRPTWDDVFKACNFSA